MEAPSNSPARFRFGDFTVDARSRLLSRNGEVITLTPRVFDTLLAFVRKPGETLSKDELMTTIWADSFVEESNLTQNVAVLRKALGENSREHKYIVTVPGTGYRFVSEVVEIAEAAPLHEAEPVVTPADPGAEADVRAVDARAAKKWWVAAAVGALAVFALGILYQVQGPAPVPKVARTRQITSFSGLDLYPAFSPTGTTIAYASDKTGAFEIYTRQLVSGANELQLTNDGGHSLQPAFSPDGSRLAYYSLQRGGVWVIPSSGGTPKRLTDFGSHPSWSPDGKLIAFQSDPLNEFGGHARNAMPPSTLWIVAADGASPPRQITTVGSPPGGHAAPEWSPDGTRIVFDANDWAASNIWSVAADGSDLRAVLEDASSISGDRWVTASDAVFAPDGKSLYYVGDMGLSVVTVPVDSSGRAIGVETKIFDAAASRIRHLAVSPDGKQLLYSALSTESNLFLSEIGADGATAEPKQLTRSADSRAVSPSFSPDGKTIVYQEYTTGSAANIRVIGLDGTGGRQISSIIGFNPWWFPTGDRVGFSVPRGSDSEYWYASADGSVEKKLFDYPHPEALNGRLTSDGKAVLFNSKQSGTINIWRIPIEGGEATQLTFDEEMAGFAAMSRDGKWIGFQLKRGGDTHVVYIPAEGGEMIQLTNEAGQSWLGDWAPDNDRLIFAGRRNAIWNIYSVSRTTREVKQLTNFTKLNSYVRYPASSPQGDKIAYEFAESKGNIWMIELN
jgi:Tol biopolymer transport system component/DNA-binding winged helix-turn-helix (wHTH) protein